MRALAIRALPAVATGDDLSDLCARDAASGKAYLCFATSEELADIRTRQQLLKRATGYYGEWAIWRDADVAAVREQLEKATPYVVRFRSPGRTGGRTTFTDAIRGELSMEANYNDVVILKSSAAVQLPTYHFAHAVDDHLMRSNLVIRGEEWLSSTSLHLQLFEAWTSSRRPTRTSLC